MYVTCGDFHDGSKKGTASVHQTFTNLGKNAMQTRTMIQQAYKGTVI
jgi:hypothetical protein